MTAALFSAGFSTFALMYCVQPLLPLFAREFDVSAAASSLAVSLTAGLLAVTMLLVGGIAETWGRKPLMVASLLLSSLLTIASARTSAWSVFLGLRALEGIAFAGLPSLAMAYLSEELSTTAVSFAMGIYVGGSALGGMTGRLLTAALTDVYSWRLALEVIGGLGLMSGVICWVALPPSMHFSPRPLAWQTVVSGYVTHLTDGTLLRLFAEGFLLMGAFVATFNYIGFRLLAPPYSLSQTWVGAIFLVYGLGSISSASAGALVNRVGRRQMLVAGLAIMMAGILVSAAASLTMIIVGIGLLTAGFFAAHSVASGWVGFCAAEAKAQASSLYLFSYYMGSSIVGAAGGIFWVRLGWTGIVLFICTLLLIGMVLATSMPEDDRTFRARR